MKIGVTTFQWADNYGALIQAHALQTFLQARGHEVQIVDYRPETGAALVRRWLSASPRGCVRKWEANWKKLLFERFRKKHLVRTPEVFRSASELRKIADRFDLLIAGSDQVWNPKWLVQSEGLFDLYFLSFAGSKTRRISYAASIGHSDLSTLTDEWKQMLAVRMKAMDAISVREQSGVELVRQLCGRTDAVCVADPTLLLDRAHYDQLAGTSVEQNPYLFSFVLHGLEQDAAEACRSVAEQLGLKIVCCNAGKTGLHSGYTLPSPEGWLRNIRDARFVVTNSFHCTVFCLIFHVPFVAVLIDGENGSMNSRITGLLKAVGLTHRIISPGEKLGDNIYTAKIDWDKVEREIDIMKTGADGFLQSQLSSVHE
jgi:hypothetical protein